MVSFVPTHILFCYLPCPVFSNRQVTVSPTLRVTVAVCVSRLPEPVLPLVVELPPAPVTVQANGVLISVEPPIPVRTQPSGTNSFTVYVPASRDWPFSWPPARLKAV